jgi:hypothetical protein
MASVVEPYQTEVNKNALFPPCGVTELEGARGAQRQANLTGTIDQFGGFAQWLEQLSKYSMAWNGANVKREAMQQSQGSSEPSLVGLACPAFWIESARLSSNCCYTK